MEELDNMELMVGYWDSLADSLLDILGACDMLAFEVVVTFEPLDDMAGAVDMLAIESVAGLYSLDEALEAVMTGTMGLVADDTTGAVDMLAFELAGHTDDLEDILGT